MTGRPVTPPVAADVVIELLDRPGRPVVFVERRFEPHGWALPGGFVEIGETELLDTIRGYVALQDRTPPAAPPRPVDPPAEPRDEMGDQEGDVLATFTQAREIEPYDVDSIVQIFPEATILYHLIQVAVGGGHHPDVHLEGVAAAHPLTR